MTTATPDFSPAAELARSVTRARIIVVLAAPGDRGAPIVAGHVARLAHAAGARPKVAVHRTSTLRVADGNAQAELALIVLPSEPGEPVEVLVGKDRHGAAGRAHVVDDLSPATAGIGQALEGGATMEHLENLDLFRLTRDGVGSWGRH